MGGKEFDPRRAPNRRRNYQQQAKWRSYHEGADIAGEPIWEPQRSRPTRALDIAGELQTFDASPSGLGQRGHETSWASQVDRQQAQRSQPTRALDIAGKLRFLLQQATWRSRHKGIDIAGKLTLSRQAQRSWPTRALDSGELRLTASPSGVGQRGARHRGRAYLILETPGRQLAQATCGSGQHGTRRRASDLKRGASQRRS